MSTGCASTERFTFPTAARKTISQRWVPQQLTAPLLAVPLRQQGELIGMLIARRIRSAPLHPGADQTARNLCRPSGDRHRERAAVQGIAGAQSRITEALEQQTATSEILGVIASSPTDIQPVLNMVAAERGPSLCEAIDARDLARRWRPLAASRPMRRPRSPARRCSAPSRHASGRSHRDRTATDPHPRSADARVDEFPEGSATSRRARALGPL